MDFANGGVFGCVMGVFGLRHRTRPELSHSGVFIGFSMPKCAGGFACRDLQWVWIGRDEQRIVGSYTSDFERVVDWIAREWIDYRRGYAFMKVVHHERTTAKERLK